MNNEPPSGEPVAIPPPGLENLRAQLEEENRIACDDAYARGRADERKRREALRSEFERKLIAEEGGAIPKQQWYYLMRSLYRRRFGPSPQDDLMLTSKEVEGLVPPTQPEELVR